MQARANSVRRYNVVYATNAAQLESAIVSIHSLISNFPREAHSELSVHVVMADLSDQPAQPTGI